jgi:Ca-activated chloride channel family protein
MKRFVKLSLIVFLFLLTVVLTSCSMPSPSLEYPGGEKDALFEEGFWDTIDESYKDITEFSFYSTTETIKTFFTLDSNTGSYANLRRYIMNGQELNSDIIKTDELINYFHYDFQDPEEGQTFRITPDLMVCPWNSEHHLVTIGVSSKKISLDEGIANNLVFLIDVSGSMFSENKLDLIKEAFPLMLDGLNATDRISIVTYAGYVTVALEATPVSERQTILNAIQGLQAGGTTAGAAGIDRAYEVASTTFINGGNNRIILATDGDFNVGPYSTDDLKELVASKRALGIYLSVLGFGMGNYKDDMVETLAMNGNGNYAYIDSLIEANKVLKEDLSTTLISIAKDVKVQVEFNPDVVEEFRIIGYENKQLTEDEFNDETKDASEVGSGHTTVVTYEVKLKGTLPSDDTPILTTTMNYKQPKTDKSETLVDVFAANEVAPVNEKLEDFIFVSCLVEFSLLLRSSLYKGDADIHNVLTRLEALESVTNDCYKAELIDLIEKVIVDELLP